MHLPARPISGPHLASRVRRPAPRPAATLSARTWLRGPAGSLVQLHPFRASGGCRLTTRCSGLATLAAELDIVRRHKGQTSVSGFSWPYCSRAACTKRHRLGQQNPSAKFAGCYQVNWGPWNPPLRDTGFVKPPDRIQLTLRSVPTPFMTGSFVVRLSPAAGAESRGRRSRRTNDATSLAFVWTARYGGIVHESEGTGGSACRPGQNLLGPPPAFRNRISRRSAGLSRATMKPGPERRLTPRCSGLATLAAELDIVRRRGCEFTW